MTRPRWEPVDLAGDLSEPDWRGDPEDLVMAAAELLELLRRPAWHRRAACRGQVRLFFPVGPRQPREAIALCGACPVIDECAAASTGEADGVWAGRRLPAAARTAVS